MASITGRSGSLPMSPFLDQIKPWVSVICTSYNHALYVEQALQSVVAQTYPNVELIVIDNASTDGTSDRIEAFRQQHPNLTFIQNGSNLGLCRAFNQGLALARGRYVIDLSADDVLLPQRIARQVELFESLAGPYAVVFSNAAYIDGQNQPLGYFYPIDEQGRAQVRVPTGRVFESVLTKHFICTPTMMMRKDVLNELGGYDESLQYEDFDIWVRTSRLYQYAYTDEVLTQKRQLPNSLGAQNLLAKNNLLESTLRVCHKAFDLCQTPTEYAALAVRLRGFIRSAFYTEQFELALRFAHLLRRIGNPDLTTSMILLLCRLHLPVNGLYRQYNQWRGLRLAGERLPGLN
jgi:glycosyltransferase involved in cell wall biosynthesis